MSKPFIEHARAEIRERLNRTMVLCRRQQELEEQIAEATRELGVVRRELTDQARIAANSAAALLRHVEVGESLR